MNNLMNSFLNGLVVASLAIAVLLFLRELHKSNRIARERLTAAKEKVINNLIRVLEDHNIPTHAAGGITPMGDLDTTALYFIRQIWQAGITGETVPISERLAQAWQHHPAFADGVQQRAEGMRHAWLILDSIPLTDGPTEQVPA